MTTLQSYMLSICTGAALGMIIGGWAIFIHTLILERKEKKKNKNK